MRTCQAIPQRRMMKMMKRVDMCMTRVKVQVEVLVPSKETMMKRR
jgi:hypothetical protein